MHRDFCLRYRLSEFFLTLFFPGCFLVVFCAFSISSSSLFVISDSGFFLLSMISIVSSKDNLVLLFDQKIFFVAASASTPLPAFIVDLLLFSCEPANIFLSALLLDFFCDLFLSFGGFNPFS